MTQRRALLLLPLVALVAACGDDPVETTQPEIEAAWVGNGYGHGIADEIELQEALDAASTAHHVTVIRLKRGATIELSTMPAYQRTSLDPRASRTAERGPRRSMAS